MARKERGGSGSGKSKKQGAAAAASSGRGRAVAGILLGGAALLALLGLWSYRPRVQVANWAGPVGHGLASALLEVAGVGAYVGAGLLFAVACALVAGRPKLTMRRWASWLVFAVAAMALA